LNEKLEGELRDEESAVNNLEEEIIAQ